MSEWLQVMVEGGVLPPEAGAKVVEVLQYLMNHLVSDITKQVDKERAALKREQEDEIMVAAAEDGEEDQQEGVDDQRSDVVMSILLVCQLLEESYAVSAEANQKSPKKKKRQGAEVLGKVEKILMRCLQEGLFKVVTACLEEKEKHELDPFDQFMMLSEDNAKEREPLDFFEMTGQLLQVNKAVSTVLISGQIAIESGYNGLCQNYLRA